MFKLSTKARYGSRFMLELASRAGEGPVLLREIAASQDISVGYLEHIARFLKAAGLVGAKSGARGGYILIKAPEDITMKDIVEAAEGPLTPTGCLDMPSVCDRVEQCVTREVWTKLAEVIQETLRSFTLKDMLKIKKDKLKKKS